MAGDSANRRGSSGLAAKRANGRLRQTLAIARSALGAIASIARVFGGRDLSRPVLLLAALVLAGAL